ncbi:MAG: hypothetical protein P8Z30_14565 [Acidobacteriota bacterium]
MTRQGKGNPERPPDINPVGKGHALWLLPEEPMFSRLGDEISRLSQEYSTPCFDPHVTLLSGITGWEEENLANLASLVSSLKPIRVELGAIGYLDEYYRCLFFNVVPAGAVLNAHQAAQEVFGLRSESAFIPHLSLVYGRLGLEAKKGIAADLSSLSGQVIELGHLKLYRVSGSPDEWGCVETFDLR